jgi:hypothetical protein
MYALCEALQGQNMAPIAALERLEFIPVTRLLIFQAKGKWCQVIMITHFLLLSLSYRYHLTRMPEWPH